MGERLEDTPETRGNGPEADLLIAIVLRDYILIGLGHDEGRVNQVIIQAAIWAGIEVIMGIEKARIGSLENSQSAIGDIPQLP